MLTILANINVCFAQEISVISFNLLENDLTAITRGTSETDQNGETAALIKIETPESGFSFNGGMSGIIKTKQTPGEIWLYVPRNIQKISITHPDLGLLKDYFFPIPIEGAKTYRMVLNTKETKEAFLSKKREDMRKELISQAEVLYSLETQANTVYVAIATRRKLRDDGILTGGYLSKASLSSTFTLRIKELKNAKKYDIRMIDNIDINSKRFKIYTNHPKESYRIEKVDDFGHRTRLVIIDREAFWSDAQYLVIGAD